MNDDQDERLKKIELKVDMILFFIFIVWLATALELML